jgi:hypothetical protein
MEITLKDIRFNAGLSDDSNAFSATLYINGKKVGKASDDGHGGETNYRATELGGWKLIREAEAWCKELPPLVYETTNVPMNLGLYIADIVFVHLQQKETDRIQRSIEKKMSNCILFGSPPHQLFWLKFKTPIETGRQVLKKAIQERVLPELKVGQKILNTNFGPEFLKMLGIDPSKIVEQSVGQREVNKLSQGEVQDSKKRRR